MDANTGSHMYKIHFIVNVKNHGKYMWMSLDLLHQELFHKNEIYELKVKHLNDCLDFCDLPTASELNTPFILCTLLSPFFNRMLIY